MSKAKTVDILIFMDNGKVKKSHVFTGNEHVRLHKSVTAIAKILKDWGFDTDINPDEVSTLFDYQQEVEIEYTSLLSSSGKEIVWLEQMTE